MESELAQNPFFDGAVENGNTKQVIQAALGNPSENTLLELQEEPWYGRKDGRTCSLATCLQVQSRTFPPPNGWVRKTRSARSRFQR